MSRAALSDEIAAVRTLCGGLGLGEVAPVLVKAAHHTTLRLTPLAVVARVQSAEPRALAMRRATTEIAVARHLAAACVPVVAPLAAARAGPHVAAGAVVTLWRDIGAVRTAGDGDAALAATALAAVHEGLRDYPGDLPPYTQTLDRCWAVLAGGDGALAADDLRLLQDAYRRLRAAIEATAAPWVPLHGDAHLGNLLIGTGGACWTDFEDTCRGPREHDLAGLPPAAWPRDADHGLIARYAALKSVCVAVWCSADRTRSAAVREAADYHLQRVRAMSACRL